MDGYLEVENYPDNNIFLKIINRYAVDFRYPGESATREEAAKAVSIIRN